MDFDYFVGIDWSGARGNSHKGIAVFVCQPGDGLPEKYSPPDGRAAFSRADVVCLLRALAQKGRVLAGIDFAFAYPLDEAGHYFPALDAAYQPTSAPEIWAMVERVNQDAPDYYGGMIWDHPEYGAYYNAPSGRKGVRFASRRRLTEQAASAVKSPSSTFNCVGPAGVGTGSLAGMRLCHALAQDAHIWPFATNQAAALTLVEIFPSYYFSLAGIKPVNGAQAKPDALNAALAYFKTRPVPADFHAAGPDHDDADALISSAALRALSADKTYWQVPPSAQREGWIFGVKSDKTPQ